MTRISTKRRAFTQAMAALPLASALPVTRAQGAKDGRKVLRYAFRVAETGFDPAQVNDLYSSNIIANIFDAPLSYDFLARPVKVVPNTAEALPEVSADFTTLTLRIRPRDFFPGPSGLRRSQARTGRCRLCVLDQAHL
jgi:ABC-type transport system substrate-binding protein